MGVILTGAILHAKGRISRAPQLAFTDAHAECLARLNCAVLGMAPWERTQPILEHEYLAAP
jgi:hypothetical protein